MSLIYPVALSQGTGSRLWPVSPLADAEATDAAPVGATAASGDRASAARRGRSCRGHWGFYESIEAGDRYQVKHLMVKPGASLSLQMHHHRAEHWVVVKGTARVVLGNREMLISENESTYIPIGTPHRLEKPGKVPLSIIEVQSGCYLGEDDIVRFDGRYGRLEDKPGH
jgi:mannose-1-phosphate guanylyltransferase/mannose-6-phosphate isomerase